MSAIVWRIALVSTPSGNIAKHALPLPLMRGANPCRACSCSNPTGIAGYFSATTASNELNNNSPHGRPAASFHRAIPASASAAGRYDPGAAAASARYAHPVFTPKLGLNTSTLRPANRRRTPPTTTSNRSPRPRITTGVLFKKSGQSDPTAAATSRNAASANGRPAISFNAHNAPAASLLPPPKPAPAGTRFSSAKLAPPRHPVAPANTTAARITRFVPSTGNVASSHFIANPAPSSARITVNVSP